ncbi:MAG: phytoene desaturase family protein, partial [Candidatus Hermodarchaeota archaeon]
GMGSMVDAMVNIIKAGGGKFLINKTVKKFMIDNGTIKGVICEDGTKEEADVVLASGGARELLLDTIDMENLPKEFILQVKDLPLMESIFMVHLGIDFDPRPYQKLSTAYYYGTYDIDGAIKECRHGIYHEGRDGFVVFIPTLFSPELAPPNHHALTVYTIAPNILNEGTWEERKEEFAEKLLIEAEKVIPNLRNAKVKVILTPEDFKDMIHVKHHAFGGMAPIMGKPKIPHEIPIKNLWFIGSQSESGAGLCPIISDTARLTKSLLKKYK